ncbi:tRNA-modifying protein YgfZ [Obesumbacterium proteus]|uniref:tRNA-modifying protein YgfZ n=1 Tax=Obesumbacterium proteus TaxID=82983 RepID=UPI0010333279|nr:tRNA-modifying protein YgfZ [Obesumbacterium proteus]MCE9883373.1 tRNA-modifying protein YgfZ [Obesumbacterium proteus]MCE9915489.1 tRNA-modifying protein YgfZ [Obesumbacterium proteus]MCE9928963.1 tRNA-modifying protein YgfZ [Obesumbacterium proteus]MCG2877895.1 tRNA-modifying protein YgfZ [Obesumbacterium proteus]TBL48595.1 tRNA-modifying protein YgfZ [Obesumbacterium proteus]
MTLNSLFAPRQPVASNHLPLTIMLLNDWQLVNVTGPDASKYLQGQLTVDVAALTEHEHTLCGHCDAKGKMWSDLRLFHRAEGFSYLVRRSVAENQITELKKYAVFSKLTISADNDAVILGVAGFKADAALAAYFPQLPDANTPAVTHEDTTLLYLSQPEARYLLITSLSTAEMLTDKLRDSAQFNDGQQWIELEIEAGQPVIDVANSGQFIPQATNLQALDGICFKKGCYTGQEMVARAKYRGANKRALYWLQGSASRVPQAGEDLELKLGENWRRTGTVLAAVQLNDGSLNVQVVLNNDLEADSVLRVRDDEGSMLTIQPLPYSLVEG